MKQDQKLPLMRRVKHKLRQVIRVAIPGEQNTPQKKGKKTNPSTFKRLTFSSECPACLSSRVHYQSDYPSNVQPFVNMVVYYCTECGTGHVRGSGPVLKHYYERDYANLNRNDRDAEPEVYFSDQSRTTSKKISRYFARANRQIALLASNGGKFNRVLDYGSGPGYFLHLANPSSAFAFEPDIESKKYLDYINATHIAKEEHLNQYQFDIIVASHSIEHLPAEDLISTLKLLIARLTHDGLMLIEVPQGGHSFLLLSARQDPHTLFFTPQGISRAVEIAGGEILVCTVAGQTETPKLDFPIYSPNPNNDFFNATEGGLTIVCRRR